MKKAKRYLWLFLVSCFLFGAVTVNAADDRLGTVVDGSLLTDGTETTAPAMPTTRGTYLGYGSGSLTIKGPHYVNAFGETGCKRISDKVEVTISLQRLNGSTWNTVYILGPKATYNSGYASVSKNYTIAGGYYYRVKGAHIVKKGDTIESMTSCTNGLWIN